MKYITALGGCVTSLLAGLGEDIHAEESLLFSGVCRGPYSLLVPCSSGGPGSSLQMVCARFLHVYIQLLQQTSDFID